MLTDGSRTRKTYSGAYRQEYALAVLSGNEIGTGIENRFLGKKDRKLQINETKAKE